MMSWRLLMKVLRVDMMAALLNAAPTYLKHALWIQELQVVLLHHVCAKKAMPVIPVVTHKKQPLRLALMSMSVCGKLVKGKMTATWRAIWSARIYLGRSLAFVWMATRQTMVEHVQT
jgi:hypothetical protein